MAFITIACMYMSISMYVGARNQIHYFQQGFLQSTELTDRAGLGDQCALGIAPHHHPPALGLHTCASVQGF